VHNEAAIVAASVATITTWPELQRFRTVDLLLVENGSHDLSAEETQRVAKELPWPFEGGGILAISEANAGIGHAYFRGAQEALARPHGSEDDWLLWSACDLPFSNSDLRSFLAYIDSGGRGGLVIGSKAHPNSQIKRGVKRSIMGLIFRVIRRIFLGLRIGDTQGTFFVRQDVLSNVVNTVQARDFFFTTEFCARSATKGINAIEVPVVLQPEVRPSTVRPLRDGLRVLKATILMRVRY
jgi:hypothetical protein